ncbi:FxSxx-COOH system tetratricopeptide repeat protein [Streptomyces sp. GC420]|uniref:FxSxx-COOH system tetratricopeptide repeat protein n=1 Tax=Streptomyces sp. GC420 TaxID=2697568 RepID=UPI00141506F2|nr:FxSxx-COOH system tetratricopeptide repeat protein [Streptomyces sp. GC420]NBM18607.1 tetratricopeptide repeat protein [Streptomyces sp. GC420]
MIHDPGDAGTQESGKVVTFYSFKGGTGRTMALANVAWILASNGKRVLAMDWDLEAPGLHRYFAPFLGDPELDSTLGVIDLVRGFDLLSPRPTGDGYADHARVERFGSTLRWDFPQGGFVHFVSSGRRTPEYSDTINTYDWRGFYERRNGKAFLTAMREDMRHNYDYALIDSRTGFSDTSGITTLVLPDVLVNCFTLNTQSVDGGADVAQDVKRAAPHVRILPVPMRVEDAEKEKLEARRKHARDRFQQFLKDTPMAADPDGYWGSVEIPYKPFYAYEEVLATVAELPRQPRTLLAAYERLTAAITDGAVTAVRPIEEPVRRQLLNRFQQAGSSGTGALPRVRIDYALRDGAWAEWISAQLQASGVGVTLRGSSPSTGISSAEQDSADVVIALLSPDFVTTPVADEVRELSALPDGPRIIGVRTRDHTVDASLTRLPGISLVDLPAEQALTQIFALLDLSAPASAVPSGPAYPGLVPGIFNVPARNNAFTGRDVLLSHLRSQLSANALRVDTPTDRVFLYGLGGIGKTQVALEYVHRYGSQYDIVHWISAEQPHQIPRRLAELGAQLNLPGETVDDRVQATLTALRGEAPDWGGKRWLLVLDNVESQGPGDAAEQLEPYLPLHGPGHVIITARRSPQTGAAVAVEVDAFTRAESVALLRRGVDGLSRQDADRIAEELGDLPMAVELAAAWLRQTAMPVETYLHQVRSRVSTVLSAGEGDNGADEQQSLTAVWRLSVDRLEQERPAAVRLLELCSFFSPEPISRSLLYSDGMRNHLAEEAGDNAVLDPMMTGHLIRDLGRYALARVDQRGQSIQVHRLVQAAVREWLAEEPERLDRTRHRAHLVLARALPSASLLEDSTEARQRFAELLPHLEPSGAISSSDPRVCEWIVRQVRNLWRIGDHRAAISLGRKARAGWSESLGSDHQLTLRLAAQLANPLRSLGRFKDAYELDSDTLHRQQELLGHAHPYTLITARNYGADLRGLGRYPEAYESDEETYRLYRESPDFGPDHDDTLRAANNLGVSLNLVGRPAEALKMATDTYQKWRQTFGPQHRSTWLAANGVALDRRETGDYQASLDLLIEIRRRLVAHFGEQSEDILRTDASLAVTRRRLGEYAAAEALSRTTLDSYRRRYGEAHPDTLSCAANLACDLLALSAANPSKAAEAHALGTENHRQYRAMLGERHPFTLASASNLVVIHLRGGRLDEALDLADETLPALMEVLGENHPATIACRANRAGVLAARERYEEALEQDRMAYDAYRELYREHHPRVLCAQFNTVLDRHLGGDQEAAAQELGKIVLEAEREFGPRHPTCRTMAARQRIDFDLEMPPI